jgi:hypothetical protein
MRTGARRVTAVQTSTRCGAGSVAHLRLNVLPRLILCRPIMPLSKRAPSDPPLAVTQEDQPEKTSISATKGQVQAEDFNPPFLLRNPARDKAEGNLRATEQKLVAAEEHANAAVALQEKTRFAARAARERLRAAEAAYVQGCTTLERLTAEFSETRFEVEVVLVRAEAELMDANEFCNRVLRDMKVAEDAADAALLLLRQAEMDHESAVQRLARMLSKSESSLRTGQNQLSSGRRQIEGGNDATPQRAGRPPMDAQASAARVELASQGIVVDAETSEQLVESLLEVARLKGTIYISQSPMPASKVAGSNTSVRLLVHTDTQKPEPLSTYTHTHTHAHTHTHTHTNTHTHTHRALGSRAPASATLPIRTWARPLKRASCSRHAADSQQMRAYLVPNPCLVLGTRTPNETRLLQLLQFFFKNYRNARK